MDTSTTSIEGGSKKVALEELSKEELVKKCRSLLTIAQKAKHARDSLVEENNKLKQLKSPPDDSKATEELIESFTQQKLDLVTKNDKLLHDKKLLEEQVAELSSELDASEEKCTTLDTECQGYKRQVSRLTEENEQLLTHLDGLEAQINELKRIGLEQQQQLLILEQNNEVLASSAVIQNSNHHINNQTQLDELQQMLTVSLDEVKKLKEENTQIQDVVSEKEAKIISLSETLGMFELNTLKLDEYKALLIVKDQELTKQAGIIDDLNTELHKNRALAEKLKQDVSNTSKRYNDNQIESSGINAELQNSNEKLREKLRSYHGKIVKLAGDVRKVKESKEYILETFKMYSEQVQLWKEQLKAVSLRMQEEMNLNLQEKNMSLKKISELEDSLKEMNNVLRENENLHKTVDVMRSQITKIESELVEKTNVEINVDNVDSKHIEEYQQFREQITAEKERSDLLKQELETLKDQLSSLKGNSSSNLLETKTNSEMQLEYLRTKCSKLTGQLEELQIKQLGIDSPVVVELQELFGQLNIDFEKLKEHFLASKSEICELKILLDQNRTEFDEMKILKDTLENEKVHLIQEKSSVEEQLMELQISFEDVLRLLDERCDQCRQLQPHVDRQLTSDDINNFKSLQTEFGMLKEECKLLKLRLKEFEINSSNNDMVVDLQEKFEELNVSYEKADAQLVASKREIKELESLLDNKQIEIDTIVKTKDTLSQENVTLKESIEGLKESCDKEKLQFEGLVSELKKAIERLESDAEQSRITESKLAEQTSATILQLSQENKSYEDKVSDLRRQLDSFQTNSSNSSSVNTLKAENVELLAEMNVMNQALKERGETISQQQAHCEELVKKIQVYETQLAKSQENVQQLQDEVQMLKSQVQHDESNDYDALSTSTISRSDQMNRMQELDGSWEERYGKLRTYAVKLKAKAKELNEELKRCESDKLELQTRCATNIKTVQSMQGQLDALQDKLDAQKEGKGKFDQLTKDNQKLLGQLATYEDAIQTLKGQVESLTREKTNLDSWKKQVGTKVQGLKKELEANTLMRKDFENRIQKLQTDLAAKDKELTLEREKHSSTRSQLHDSNTECKKQSVLNLEMQDYERSIKELSSKLEKKNDQVTKLKNQIDSQKSTVSASKEQKRLTDEKCNELELELDACRIEIKQFKKQIADLECIIGDKELKIDEITKMLEALRSENEDLSTQLSKIIAEHQKVNQLLRDEKDHFRNENVDLESRCRQLTDQLKLRNDELENVNGEYQSYKVRAQSVLRQNQSRDVGVEEKLTEEAASLRAQMLIYLGQIDELKSKLKSLETSHQKLTEDAVQLELSRKDIQDDLDTANSEIEKLNLKHLQTIQEHNETVRSLKLHTETLSQCYRQQISEQELRHNREIIEWQSKYDKNPMAQTDIPSLLIPSTVREEGEGSESVDSNNGNNIHPLEKLLGADQDQELQAVRKQLNENEVRVVHLTALLADTEQDLSKHMQMNKVLKEEIRRQQRSVERERHAENLEYMKNVVFKFITLNNSDERLRLVPVLNTILKLSPEETTKLNTVAKGDSSWSNYLPLWSGGGGSKPQ